MTTTELLLLVGGIIGGVAVTFFFLRRQKPTEDTNEVTKVVADNFDRLLTHVDRRLQEHTHAVNESKSFLADRVSAAERTVREVSTGLGKLEIATAALHQTNREIASFQQMLKSPKVRGGFGEVLLGNLLADVLPGDRYEMQYTFPGTSEIADAIVKLQDGYMVAVDAKFPLANYESYMNAENEDIKMSMRKQFIRDVKKHIDDISKKYISPRAHTLDFAFMYIPLEGVYYEAVLHDSDESGIWKHCQDRKVIPVSPNTFLAYLHTVLIGLRGLKIEQQAKEILATLGQVRKDFGAFSKDFSAIGGHLNNAKNRYDDSSKRLDKFMNRLDQIEVGEQSALPEAIPEPSSEEIRN